MKIARFLLLSDVHGNVNGLKRLLKSRYSERHKFDGIIISGDLPITTPLSLILNYMIINRNLSRTGYSKAVYLNELRKKFIHHQKNSIKSIMNILLKFELKLFYIPGNIETREAVTYLNNFSSNVIDLDERFYRLNEEINLFGIGGSLDHLGVICDYEYSVEDFNEKIKRTESKIIQNKNEFPSIFVYHEPPRFTRSKEDLQYLQNKAKKRGYPNNFPVTVGSDGLYRLVERHNPALVINGHFHEYSGSRKINNSTVINPGAFATYNYAIVTIYKEKQVKIKSIFYKVRPSIFSFTNFLYQKRAYALQNTRYHN